MKNFSVRLISVKLQRFTIEIRPLKNFGVENLGNIVPIPPPTYCRITQKRDQNTTPFLTHQQRICFILFIFYFILITLQMQEWSWVWQERLWEIWSKELISYFLYTRLQKRGMTKVHFHIFFIFVGPHDPILTNYSIFST